MIEKYIEILKNLNLKMGLNVELSTVIAETISTLSLVILSMGIFLLIKFILKKTIYKIIQLSTNKYDDLLLKNKVIGRIYPIFGICLGHQMISLAYGAKTYKLKFGHRGGNHPVKNLETGKIEITSQNHSYAVDLDSLKNTKLKATHINLLDNTVEGVECVEDMVFSVQYHPESAPGPQDSSYLFEKFTSILQANLDQKSDPDASRLGKTVKKESEVAEHA